MKPIDSRVPPGGVPDNVLSWRLFLAFERRHDFRPVLVHLCAGEDDEQVHLIPDPAAQVFRCPVCGITLSYLQMYMVLSQYAVTGPVGL